VLDGSLSLLLYILILFDPISLWNGISEYGASSVGDTNFMHTAGIQHAVLHPCKMDGSMELDLASCTLTEIPKHVIAGEISFKCYIYFFTMKYRTLYA
jgi:hypothetical protein